MAELDDIKKAIEAHLRGYKKSSYNPHQADPLDADETAVFQEVHGTKFPYNPGAWGGQLAKDVADEFVPQAGQSEKQNIYKLNQALLGAMATGPGGGAGTLAAVKGKGGMWHPNARNTLSDGFGSHMTGWGDQGQFAEQLARQNGVDGLNKQQEWVEKISQNYLNKYAGTPDDPLKDIEVPFHQGQERWEALQIALLAPSLMSSIRLRSN